MTTARLSGIETLRQHVADPDRRSSIFATMGMTDVVVAEGHVIIHARADARHLNPMGAVHGGFAATVLDSVTGCAVHTLLEPGVSFATIDLAIKMLRPIPLNEDVISEARVTHRSRSLGVAEGTVRDRQGRLLASGTATCFIKQAPAASS